MSVPGRRFAAQALSGAPLSSPPAVAERLLAVQAQDRRGFRLAVRARTSGLRAADVDAAIASRELVVDWLLRRTLHLVARDDHGWLHGLMGSLGESWSVRRLAGLGVHDPARGAAAVVRALKDGPLSRAQLGAALASAGHVVEGQALIHQIALASYRGDVVRGPWIGTEQAFVLRRDWLGEPEPVDRDAALAELARRYLAGHGPAAPSDLARWSGLGLRAVRAGLAAAGAIDAGHGLVDLPGRADTEELPAPKLLGPFDPVLHGWPDRAWLTSHDVVTVNGIFRACALVEGRIVATWRGDAELSALEPFDPSILEAEIADVRRFEGPG